MNAITESLIENSKSAIIACIELHNKPIFSYRYEVCTILLINGWELILKAYISENCPEVKLIRKDSSSKPFDECVGHVSSSIGKKFRVVEENINKLYEFRCHIIHFYKDRIDTIIYSLLHKSILLYNDFLKTQFNIDLTEETNLILLPIGFKPFISPVDFLSKQSEIEKSSNSVQTFIKSIVNSTEKLIEEDIEDSILTGFNIAIVNENRIKNTDIIVGITKNQTESKLSISKILKGASVSNDDDAKIVSIEEESLFKTFYTLTYGNVIKEAKQLYTDFIQNANFNRIMREIKKNPTIHKKRFLDIINKTGTGRDYYSLQIFDELSKHYTLKN